MLQIEPVNVFSTEACDQVDHFLHHKKQFGHAKLWQSVLTDCQGWVMTVWLQEVWVCLFYQLPEDAESCWLC